MTIDDLAIGCTPRPLLQILHDLASFTEPGEPPAESRGAGGPQEGDHHAFDSDCPLVPGCIGAGQGDRPVG